MRFWVPNIDWARPKELGKLITEFEDQSGLAVKVSAMEWSTLPQKLLVAVAGNASPDVVLYAYDNTVSWASKGIIRPVESLLPPAARARDLYPDGLLQSMIHRKKLFAVPFDFQLRGLFWNIDLLQQAGLPSAAAPRDLVTLDVYAAKLTKVDANKGFSPLGFYPTLANWYLQGWFAAFGGGLFDWAEGRPQVDTPENLQCLGWMDQYARLYPIAAVNRFYSSAGGREWDAFARGKLAIQAQAATYIPLMRKEFPKLAFETGRVPHAPGGRNGIWAGCLNLVVPTSAKNLKGAGQLIAFLVSERVQERWYKLSERFPGNLKAHDKIVFDDPQIKNIFVQAREINARPPHYDLFAGPLDKLTNAVMNRTQSPAQALKAAQDELDKAFRSLKLDESWKIPLVDLSD